MWVGTVRLMRRFFIPGDPKPKGSVSAFPVDRKGGRTGVVVVHRASAWEAVVAHEAAAAWKGGPVEGPLQLNLEYRLARPKSVSEAKRPWPHVRPDIDKLERAVLDGLTGVVFRDDAQVVIVNHAKRYASEHLTPGVEVEVFEL